MKLRRHFYQIPFLFFSHMCSGITLGRAWGTIWGDRAQSRVGHGQGMHSTCVLSPWAQGPYFLITYSKITEILFYPTQLSMSGSLRNFSPSTHVSYLAVINSTRQLGQAGNTGITKAFPTGSDLTLSFRFHSSPLSPDWSNFTFSLYLLPLFHGSNETHFPSLCHYGPTLCGLA